VINPANRTFKIEIQLPNDKYLRPNQVAILTFCDYYVKDAVTVPSRIILTDRKGDFVYRIDSKDGESRSIKTYVSRGITYQGMAEIKSGLKHGLRIVDKGAYETSHGALVKVVQ